MLLNITALTKTYTISGKLITALNTVDLTFSENSFTCIVGKSGCGKTTLPVSYTHLTLPTIA